MAAMGLAKGSVYKGFGDKKSLFLRALDRYLERGYRRLKERVTEPGSPRENLRFALHAQVDMAVAEGDQRGCFAVNCIVELAPHDKDVQAKLRRHLRRVERLYADALKRGALLGEFRSNLEPKRASRWLSTVLSGIQVGGKAGMTRAEGIQMVEFTLNALN
jgi:TetR/AcrR family transcriptional regulator, transcriptional repressor for nem operon